MVEKAFQEDYLDLVSPAPVFRQMFIKSSSEKINDHYTILESEVLGNGTYGSVLKAIYKQTGQERAIKVIPRAKVSNPERFKTEIEILKTLDHPNVIKLYETYEDIKNIYLVMEVCQGGELFDRITSKGNFNEKEARHAFTQMISAINYCHLRNIAHRDLKPENFLYLTKDENSPLKIIDFGLSKIYGDPEIMVSPLKPGKSKGNKVVMKTRAGTPYYIAPEVLDANYNEICDIWSAGVILYIMLCGYPPFYGDTDREILLSVKKGIFEFSGPEWLIVSNDVKDLIKKCLVKSDKRLKAYEVLAHKWMKIDLVKKIPLKSELNFQSISTFLKFSRLKKSVLAFISSQLSDIEIGDLKNLFIDLDKDEDGVLGWEEFRKSLINTENVPENLIKKLFDAVNMSKSGFITYNEFLALSISKSIYLQEDRIKSAFRIFDIKDKGKINRNDLKSVFGKHKYYEAKPDSYWEKMLTKSDFNKDGLIDINDFMEMMKSD